MLSSVSAIVGFSSTVDLTFATSNHVKFEDTHIISSQKTITLISWKTIKVLPRNAK